MDHLDRVALAKDNIRKQASMAVIAIVVTVVLVFAMSVAWYSNVIHTEGLVFKASSWDFEFEGKIAVGAETQDVGPGDSGIVSLKLENASDDTISVLVNATKNTTSLSEEMKKRIYFYVEDGLLVNGEYMDRVYINETDDYAYTVLGQSTLTLNDDYYSDPYLKWEWVYDVLGYYVMGTVKDGVLTEVEDYMRPVQYDLDTATFDADGKLAAVGNAMTREDYVKSLLETDGFASTANEINTIYESGKNTGYYPVLVDKTTGRGVWLYLCTKGEIEANTQWDTQVAENIKETPSIGEFSARLLISGQASKEAIQPVTTADALIESLNNESIDRITLSNEITLSDSVTITGGREVVMDLNELALNLEKDATINVAEGSSLVLLNGDLTGTNTDIAINAVGADVTLSKVDITNAITGIRVADDEGTGLDSHVKIVNSKINTTEECVMLRGNSDKSDRSTSLLIENSELSSGYVALMGNGSAIGTDIQIIGSTLTGTWSGIYQPQADSHTEISGSQITGYTAIAIKGGSMVIGGSSVIWGNGTQATPGAFATSGYTDTGDGVYIETNYNTDIRLEIGGNSVIKSDKSYAVQVYEPNAPQVEVIITGGVFSTSVADFLTEEYEEAKLNDGTYKVGEKAASASE